LGEVGNIKTVITNIVKDMNTSNYETRLIFDKSYFKNKKGVVFSFME